MGKNIPSALAERQEFQRRQTINKVLHAIQYLSDNGTGIDIAELVRLTGLSRSVFAKPHVRKVLDEHYEAYKEAEIEERKQIEKDAKKEKKIRGYNERIKRLTEENAALKEECELLRGRLFLLMQRL